MVKRVTLPNTTAPQACLWLRVDSHCPCGSLNSQLSANNLPSAMMHDPKDRSFIGHPRGLGYIAFAEAWERFSYYGMQALLVLYMVNRLLHPGHIENILVFGPFRHLIESFRGPLSVQALASTIFGLYTGLV